MPSLNLSGYTWQAGTTRDRPLLIDFARRTYSELYPQEDFSHLSDTVDRLLSAHTPLWWVEADKNGDRVACLWIGRILHPLNGRSHSQIFLLYVDPAHRRQGIATALVKAAMERSRCVGEGHLGVQVFANNHRARQFYEKLGFETLSFLTIVALDRPSDRPG